MLRNTRMGPNCTYAFNEPTKNRIDKGMKKIPQMNIATLIQSTLQRCAKVS